jgi:hypothetical protein
MANSANAYAAATYATQTTVATNATSANNYAGAMANAANVRADTKVASVSGTSGRVTSSGGTNPTIDLATAGAGAASYTTGISAITVDAYGRVTAVTGSASYATTTTVATNATSANNYAGAMANSANAYAAATYATQTTVATNATSANNYAGAMANSGNAWTSATFATITTVATNATSANNYAGAMANAANAIASATYATQTTVATNATSANNYAGAMANSANNYASATYPTKSGTGASGTWGISITGTANSVNATNNSIYVQTVPVYGLTMFANQFNAGYNWDGDAALANGAGQIAVNYAGYLNSSTRFRDVAFFDGKNALTTWFQGSTKSLFSYGNITAYYSSDQRLKENVIPIDNALAKVMEIRGVNFDWTDDYLKDQPEDEYFTRKHDVGVIAQEIEKVLPEAVATRSDGIKAVRYEKIVPLLIEAIKELKQEVELLKSKGN